MPLSDDDIRRIRKELQRIIDETAPTAPSASTEPQSDAPSASTEPLSDKDIRRIRKELQDILDDLGEEAET